MVFLVTDVWGFFNQSVFIDFSMCQIALQQFFSVVISFLVVTTVHSDEGQFENFY